MEKKMELYSLSSSLIIPSGKGKKKGKEKGKEMKRKKKKRGKEKERNI